MVTDQGTLQRAWAQPAFIPFLCETQERVQEHSGLLISGEVRARRRFTGATGCWAELELFRKGHFLRPLLNNADEIQCCLVLAIRGRWGFRVSKPALWSHQHFKITLEGT